MWIVQLALRRQYTFIVMALLIVILGVFTIQRTPTDIFPVIDIPVVSVIWSYGGISPDDMEKRICTISERAATTTVADIEHIESQSMPGITVIKFYFQPGAKVEAGVAQLTSINQTLLRVLPPGTTPPLIIRYSASSVPILQLGVGGKGLSEQQLYDNATNFVRTQLATIQGASVPLPYGGKPRQIMVDLDLPALHGFGLTPIDVNNAISAQNLILPAGTAKFGEREYNVFLNSSPDAVEALNNMPIKQVNGAMVYIRDVAQVHDGYAVQANIVTQNGRRSALLTILKSGDASTLNVVGRVKEALPKIKKTLPPELELEPLFDQSLFVRASVNGVIREALIAACLTAAMILLFLGSWRSTLIVAISIPLSILTSIIFLGFLGQTMNVMTLGGLALAVGILVDDATVEIENIHRNLGQGKPLQRAILDGAQQIATPTFVATLSICIVFVSVVFLYGPAKYLFTPLALAVVFAMLASYLLSRTLVPVMVKLLLNKELHLYREAADGSLPVSNDPIWRVHQAFNRVFERFRNGYRNLLNHALHHRAGTMLLFGLFFAVSFLLLPLVGQDFFPKVDAGQFRLHVRAPAGTRIEETERLFHQVEDTIRETIPAKELNLTLDNIGLPVGGVNLAFSDTATIGSADGEILVSLKEEHGPTPKYVEILRQKLNARYPQMTFFFQPADIVSQILNFGLPAPIDIQVTGRDKGNYALAKQIAEDVKLVQGAVDVHVHQVRETPSVNVNVDREMAQTMGMTQRDVANSLLISLSSSGQASPNYWLDPKNGVSYAVAVQTPQYKMDTMDALANTPLPANGPDQLLSNVATFKRGESPQVINHYNVQPVFDIYANVQGRDLGGVARDIDKLLQKYNAKLPRGTTLTMRGQVDSMNASFVGLGIGIAFAVILVYLLMVVNFQSWLDPFIIITALPGAFSGILWMLFVSQTTFSVPSLMGAIMCIGVATANSILLVTFANDRRAEGDNAREAALAAGFTRLRPVLMTALAMIIGMLPMALGLGEGGEQNAPLGRAVIGGLLLATATTLFFVPVVYSVLRRKQPHAITPEEPEAHAFSEANASA
ncbi:MAG TPA: efflux RND transporter permease subunit [Chthonomonadaceae bacterium]|nr:efflux RND transporter permease subunit [Chthonomonadaceae bacterium]